MIRHVVVWKLAAIDPTQKEADAAAISEALRDLVGVVPSIRSLTVGPNVVYPEANWDLALVVDFDDAAGLREYQEHPRHTAVGGEVVKPRVSERASVDFAL